MADRTHRAVLIRRLIFDELVKVTADARIVAGIFEGFGFAVSAVARNAVKLLVFGYLVVKGGESRIRIFYNRRFRRLGSGQRYLHFLFLLDTACGKHR